MIKENIWKKYSKEEILINDKIKIYKGKNIKTGNFVIIKELNKTIFKRLYKNEIEIIKLLNCENSISLIEELEDELNYYIIIELCLFSLKKYIDQINQNKLSINEIKNILIQINKVLKIMNDNKIIHSNLNLSNILLSIECLDNIENNIIFKLSNYTFSKRLNKDKIYIKNIDELNIQFISPEIIENNFICEKSDIWSLGISIYYMLFKKYPFNGKNKEEILNDIKLNKKLESSNNILLDDLLYKMLTVDLNKRISWNEYLNHNFFHIKNEENFDLNQFNFLCEKHLNKKINYYCKDCKNNICENCYIETHSSHHLIQISKIGFSNKEIKIINTLKKRIDNIINQVNNMKNNIEILYDKIKNLKENNSIYKNDTPKNNIKEYLKQTLNYITEKLKIKEINLKIKSINDIYLQEKNLKIQITNSNLKKINSLESHDDWINSISTFPSGNIISVSYDMSIKIYDNNLNIIQIINNAHNNGILNINIKDENNFVTSSIDKNIKTWIKKEKIYELNKKILNAHNGVIRKIIYCNNYNIISCSIDKTIKIWELNNKNEYENIIILTHYNEIFSLLLIEKKNILISSGFDGTRIWNFNNLECINYLIDVKCCNYNSMKKIEEDKIIIGEKNGFIKIISLIEKRIIKEIENEFTSYGICVIDNKGVFLIGGSSNDIKIYRNDNFECIQIVKNAHNYDISDLIELNNGLIASCSYDRNIILWSF